MTSHLENKLLIRRKFGHLRQLKVIENLIDFSSNDYLGLARSADLAKAFLQEWENHLNPFTGSTGSRLLTGNSNYAQDLEERISSFHGFEAGLLFNSGYMANLGLLSAIGNEESVFFYDLGVHASTHDGILLSKAKAVPFKHNDLQHLEERLKKSHLSKNRFICIESIYSTDGSMAPVLEICKLSQKYNAHMIVDEAHSAGIYGSQGRGLISEYGLTDKVFAIIVTFGKALGTFGAIVLGSSLLKETLINFAKSFIFTTALPFQTLASIKCCYDLFPKLEKERQNLKNLINRFRNSLPSSSITPIQPILISGNEQANLAAQHLQDLGFDVRALLSPTVKRRNEVLRICLHSFNTEHELSLLLNRIPVIREPLYA